MSTYGASVFDAEVVDVEVVDLGRGRLHDDRPMPDLGPLEIGSSAHIGEQHQGVAHDGSPHRQVLIATMLAFTLGLTSGVVAARAGGDGETDTAVALEAGPPRVTGDLVPLGPTKAIAAVVVPVHNTGAREVAVHSVQLVGWQFDELGSAREPVTVPAGQVRAVSAGAQLDCIGPRPASASVAEMRVRVDDLGIVSLNTRLTDSARELTGLWDEVC